MISLPLMLGMGVDNGINIVYDFRRQQGKYRMSPSTAVAVILNTLDDHGRIRGVDDCRPSRTAKPGSHIDDRDELLPGVVVDYFARVFGLAYPKSQRRGRRIRRAAAEEQIVAEDRCHSASKTITMTIILAQQ